MENVVILGVGLTPFGRYPDKKGNPTLSFEQIGRIAVAAALKDAGVEAKQLQATYCSTMIGPIAAAHRIMAAFGLNGMPIVNIENACAGGGTCMGIAVNLIRSGEMDLVLAIGIDKMPHGFIELDIWPKWIESAGMNLSPFFFASRARRHMHEYGSTPEHFAKVCVKNRRHGVHNPYAMYRSETTVEEVLNAPMVCDPLTRLMLCAPNEGAAAMVLCSEKKAKQYTTKPVYVGAAAVGTFLEGEATAVLALPQIHGVKYLEKPTRVTVAVAKKAYEMAGLGPKDLDLVELQDTDAAAEIIEMEQLGICDYGEGARLIDEGVTALGSSKRPIVSASGGLLSKGEPVGASGLAQAVELTWQLRGEAKGRQVENAKVGLGQTIGMGGNTSVIIVKK